MHLEERPSSPAGITKAIQAATTLCGQPKGMGEGLAKPSAASLDIVWVPGSLGTRIWRGPGTQRWHFSCQLRRHKDS